MSNSYTQYKNHGYWFRTDAVRNWFVAMSETITAQPHTQKPDWLDQLAQQWWHDILTEAPGAFHQRADTFIKTPDHADIILQTARATLKFLESPLPQGSNVKPDCLPWTLKMGEWFILLITQEKSWDPANDDASNVCLTMPFARKQAYRSLLLKALTQMASPSDSNHEPLQNVEHAVQHLQLIQPLAKAQFNNFWDFHEGEFWRLQAHYTQNHLDSQAADYPRWFEAFLASPESTTGPASPPTFSTAPRGILPPPSVSPAAKNAYRLLLNDALAIIHQITNTPPTWRDRLTLGSSAKNQKAADLAQWVQTLAEASANDFDTFDEDKFWLPYAQMSLYFPAIRAWRITFERRL